eukprot:323275_1
MTLTILLLSLVIYCVNSQFNTTNANETNSNGSTTTYTTSTPSDDCDYFSDNIYTILPSQAIFDSIIVRNNTIEIQFDAKLNSYCNTSSCNIFCIHNEHDIGSISLSINGIKNYFMISITNQHNYNDDYKIPNASVLLPMDNDFHNIYMSYKYGLNDLTHNENIFKVDNTEYSYYATASVSGTMYNLYMSRSSDNIINASVSNICITSKSSADTVIDNDPCPQCISHIKCGQIITGELTFKSENSRYYFNLSRPASVLFDSCGSSFDTYLRLYDMQDNILFQGDDDGYCTESSREQLPAPALDAGEYILGISGWNSWGWWTITTLCYYDDETDDAQYSFWTSISCCGNIDIENHAIFASWKGILFVVDEYKIHYSPLDLFDNDYNWNYVYYNTQDIKWDIIPYYAQYQSSIYMYIYKNDAYENDILVQINLTDLNDVTFEIVPNNRSWTGDNPDKLCIVANANSVYIVRAPAITVYDIHTRFWKALKVGDESDAIFGCTMDRNYNMIYAIAKHFGPFTFDIVTEEIGFVPLIGPTVKGALWSDRCSFITGWNDKIYLHRCVLLQCDQIIVQLSPLDSISPSTLTTEYTNIISASSQLMLYDDNIILLQSKDFNHATSLYFTVTNMISINFTSTILSESIWPSDGFAIKYYLNDFSNQRDYLYHIWFHSKNKSHNINASITLNISNDNCICGDYNCHNCSQHFELDRYLMLEDNDINEVEFYILSNNHSDMLILPETIPIKLQRCIITLNIADTTDTNITFNFGLSNNCYLRIEEIFSLNITSSSLDISKELIIQIISNTNQTCKLCDMHMSIQNDCVYCDDKQNTFSIRIHEKIQSDQYFEISLESNMIDLVVIPSTFSDTILYSYSYPKDININNSFLYLLFLLIIPCILIFIVYTYCNKQYMNAFIVDKSLILIIGISQFDDKTCFLP